MRCEEARELLEERQKEDWPAALQDHLAACSACADYGRDWRVAREGLWALAAEPVPEASIGFATRLIRGFDEAVTASQSEAFFERIGRRFVYGALMLTALLLMALATPSSGPVRGATTADLFLAQTEPVTSSGDPFFADEPSQNLPPGLEKGMNGPETGQK